MKVELPTVVRRLGWALAVGMLLYPVDTVLARHAMSELAMPIQPTISTAAGMQMDLRSMAIHCGPLGWAGAWSMLLGLVWLAVALSLSLWRTRGGKRLGGATSRAMIAILAGLVVVVGTMAVEYRFGV